MKQQKVRDQDLVNTVQVTKGVVLEGDILYNVDEGIHEFADILVGKSIESVSEIFIVFRNKSKIEQLANQIVRELAITHDDCMNVRICLETANTVEDFIAMV